MTNKSGLQIKSGALISYLAIAISIVSALLYTPWMKNQIGDSNYAIYSLASSLIAIFLMDFGLGTSVTRFVAKYRAENNESGINNILGYVIKLYIAIDIIIFILLTIVYFQLENIYTGLNVSEIEVLKKVFVVVAGYSVFSFPFTPLTGILNAYEKFIELKLCDLFQKLSAILLIVIALMSDYGVVALVLMNALSGTLAIVVRLYIIKRNINIRPNLKIKDSSILKSLASFSLWATVLALAQRMIFNLAPSILGITSNSMEIARFAPASQLEGYFFTFAFAINGLFMPTIARYTAQSDVKSCEKLLTKVGRYQMSILGLLFSGIAVVGTEFMELWMGKEYRMGGICALIMIAPSLLAYPQQIANTMISVQNKIKYSAISAVIMAITNIILSFVLTPKLGVWGASISIGIAYTVNWLILNVVYHKQLNLNLKGFYLRVYLKHIPAIAICIVISIVICNLLSITEWTGLLIKAVIVSVIYVISLTTIAFSHNEIANLFKNLKDKFKI